MIKYSDWGQREITLFGSIPHNWGTEFSLTCSTFPCRRSWAEIFLGPKFATLGRDSANKVKLFLLHSPVYPNCHLAPMHFGTSLLETWASIMVLLFMRDYLRQYLQGPSDHVREKIEPFMVHCRVHSQDNMQGPYACSLTHRWRRFLLGPLASGAGSHSTSKALLSMYKCQIVVVEVSEHKQGTSY